METIVLLCIGDPSADGHGHYKDIYLKTNKTYEELEKIKVKANTIVDFHEIFSDYEENSLTQEKLEELKEKGIDFTADVFKEEYTFEETDKNWFNPQSATELYIQTMKLADPTLEMEVTFNSVPCLDVFGYGLITVY